MKVTIDSLKSEESATTRIQSRDRAGSPVIDRRGFVALLGGLGLGLIHLGEAATGAASGRTLPSVTPGKLPLWHGFNLLEKFNGRNDPFREQDFAWIAELGFNFVRLPMDYRGWIENRDWTKFREPTLKEIDEAVKFGEKHAVHVQLNFHRAPGYTVASPPEEKPVWTDEEALRVCALHWAEFARRYQGIPSRQLSFNLLNEPARVAADPHRKVVVRLAEAIRQHDPDRLIVCDGREWGTVAPTELIGLGVADATRGYQPSRVSHYQASWVSGSDKWPEPTWPLREGNTLWNKATLRERQIEPWRKLEAQGVGVMVGEFGAFSRTPHPVVLAWLTDQLGLWKEAGWGWALWNFNGGFGILDSGRTDVTYESWRGHKLDRAMLELLQAHKG